jgi:hypothetical protein
MHAPDTWLLQIYRMSDATAQTLTTGLLTGIDDLAVESVTDGPDCYVIVESTDDDRGASVTVLVMAVDPDASIVHTSRPASGRPYAA